VAKLMVASQTLPRPLQLTAGVWKSIWQKYAEKRYQVMWQSKPTNDGQTNIRFF